MPMIHDAWGHARDAIATPGVLVNVHLRDNVFGPALRDRALAGQ
jgi:hypothetical protein